MLWSPSSSRIYDWQMASFPVMCWTIFFGYPQVFDYPQAQAFKLNAMASAIQPDCSQIQEAGFYIVSGTGPCRLDQVVSSASAPVILLINEMAIISPVPTQFYGLLIWQGVQPQILSLANGSQLNGALVIGVYQAELRGDFSLRFDGQVLCILSACQAGELANPFRLLSTVPGSWHYD